MNEVSDLEFDPKGHPTECFATRLMRPNPVKLNMDIITDTDHDRRVEVEENDETGGYNLYELDSDDNQKWRIGHIDTETYEERVESGRYVE